MYVSRADHCCNVYVGKESYRGSFVVFDRVTDDLDGPTTGYRLAYKLGGHGIDAGPMTTYKYVDADPLLDGIAARIFDVEQRGDIDHGVGAILIDWLAEYGPEEWRDVMMALGVEATCGTFN
jgi:hypothetical protein